MATASGKTFTAIMGSYYLFKEIGKLCTVVLVPSKQLVKQWGKELKKYTDNVVLISSDEKNWKSMVADFVFLFRMDKVDHLYIVSTIQSYMNRAEKMLLKIPSQQKLLIADEAHWIGAVEAQAHFKGTAPIHALGLTATPVRYFDEEGTDFLYTFLGKVVFEFTIKDGQDRGYLCKYNYHVEFCDLDRSELREYVRLTKSIVMAHGNDDKEKLTMLLNKRAKVVKDAKSKFEEFDRVLSGLEGGVDRCVVYCDENQIDTVCTILREHDLIFNTFLGTTPDHERQMLISKLTSGVIDVIVAIKCLNEGVDIPPLKMGFFISSSGNPKEFIQRRGRLLRVCEGKDIVDMYDFVVAPDMDQLNLAEPEKKAHDKIIKKELDRVKEFNDNALNSAVNEQKILERLNMMWRDVRMVHNFKSEIEKIECDPAIKDCLKELYASEECGLSEPSEIPNLTYYENTIDEYYTQADISDLEGD
jgi:superfamily II DNA or RNA helicase